MQSLRQLLRNSTVWGAGALVLVGVISLVAAWLYISPPGERVVTFYTTDAGSIRPGDLVRIAGINVGKVSDLALEQDRVRVRARVDGNAFVGDESQVEVRMLTVVGGYYVDIASLGDAPLGATPIPQERVKMPYNLTTILADSTKITENVQGNPLKESLDQLQRGLTGNNVDSLASVVDAGNALVSTIEKQRGQLTSILQFTNQYVAATNAFQDGLRLLIGKISIAIQTLVIYGDKFGDGIFKFGAVLGQLAPVAYFYRDHRAEFMEKVRHYLETARMWSEHNGAVVRSLRLIQNKLTRVLDAQNAPPQFLATDLCVPLEGSPC